MSLLVLVLGAEIWIGKATDEKFARERDIDLIRQKSILAPFLRFPPLSTHVYVRMHSVFAEHVDSKLWASLTEP